MKKCYSFVYLDEKMIDMLFPQIFDNVAENTISSTTTEQFDSEIKANLLGILNSSIDGQDKNTTSNSIKIINSIYKKAQLLINYFKNDNIINISDIINNNLNNKESIYFVGRSTFFLSDIYNKNSGASLFQVPYIEDSYIIIDKNAVFVLETGNTYFVRKHCSEYIDTDDYYALNHMKKLNYGIIMHMSNEKIQKDIRHLTNKIKRSKHFNFYVFGELMKESNHYYKISPYAVWQ